MARLYKFIIPFILLVWFLSSVAHAQGFRRSLQLKNVSEARGLAVNNTILPVAAGIGAAYLFKNRTVRTAGAALAVYGLVMGPSAGNFYAEDYLRGGLGVVSRAGSGYLLMDATRELMGDKVADPLGWDNKHISLTDTRVLAGAGIFLGSIVYNLISSKASVNEYNRNPGYSLYITPQNVVDEPVPLLTAQIRF